MKSRTKKRPLTPPLPALPPAIVVRMFLLASVSVIACVWALLRYYHHVRPPMIGPAPQGQTVEPPVPPEQHPDEIPAPSLVPAE